MFTPDQLNSLSKSIMERLGLNEKGKNKDNNSSGCDDGKKKLSLTPSQVLVIAGILGGTLEVASVLVDKDQIVQIILQGSLKQKTELEKMMDKIGSMPFDEVVKAMLGRL